MKKQKGQALIPVMIVLMIVITLGAAMLYLTVGGMIISFASQEGEEVLVATEGAMENGLLRVLRNPTYTGESLQVDQIPCTISVAGQSPIVVTAQCQSQKALRRLEAAVSFVAGQMVVDGPREIQ